MTGVRYLCPGCERLVAPASVLVEGRQIRLACPACSAEQRLAATGAADGPAEEGGARAGPEPGCPKCGHPRGGAEACSRCGLVFARWDALTPEDDPPHLVTAWQALETRWEDDDAHRRFVDRCLAEGALAFAARRYRSRDDETARRQLTTLTTIAVQTLRGVTTRPRLSPRGARLLGLLVLALVLVGLAVLAVATTK